MKQFLIFFSVCLWATPTSAQELYLQTFGTPNNPTLIFLHGGPGYNSASFEQTTAAALAEQGFYVVVYDRRGEGRSAAVTATFTWEESFADLNQLYKQLHLKKAILLGHSFGGILGTLYAERYPKRVQGLVLMSAPLDLQATFDHIRARCTAIYKEKNDLTNLYYMGVLATMDKTSMDYASYCFAHAMQNGFYNTATPSEAAQELYTNFKTDPVLLTWSSKMTPEAPLGFWKNEQYTSLDIYEQVQKVQQYQIPVLGLYGQEDGLFDPKQLQGLKDLIGTKQFFYWEDCSHNVFIDQQALFLESLQNWATNHE